ncbi:MAG: hypothetical protein KDA60_04585 [Planctomycetales bacterium]|nr:hypothetical protein [Planctomycetales bacterium]
MEQSHLHYRIQLHAPLRALSSPSVVTADTSNGTADVPLARQNTAASHESPKSPSLSGTRDRAPATGATRPAPSHVTAVNPEALFPQLDSETTALLREILNAVKTLNHWQTQMLADLQEVAVEIAVAVAGKLAFTKIKQGEFPIEALVREMTEQFSPNQPLTVKLHPNDVKRWQAVQQEAELNPAEMRALKVVADPFLAEGSCRVDGDTYGLASDHAQRVNMVRARLMDGIEHAQAEC